MPGILGGCMCSTLMQQSISQTLFCKHDSLVLKLTCIRDAGTFMAGFTVAVYDSSGD